MTSTLKKAFTAISEIFTAVCTLIIILKTISNKNEVVNFFLDTFKEPLLFLLFIILFVSFLITLQINYKIVIKLTSFSPAEDVNKSIIVNRFNRQLKYKRITFGILSIISFSWLLYTEFKIDKFGILGGSFGENKIFTEQLTGKIKNGKPPNFKWVGNNDINYSIERSRAERHFKRHFSQGVLYTGQYDNSSNDSVINMDVRWIGNAIDCPVSTDYYGQFTKCTIDVNFDANLVSNFILGFTYMHLCKKNKALGYFKLVYNSIADVTDVNIRARLIPLRDTLDLYTNQLMEATNKKLSVAKIIQPQQDIDSNRTKIDTSQVAKIDEYLKTGHPVDSTGIVVCEPEDVYNDTFSNMPADSIKEIIRSVDMNGRIETGVPNIHRTNNEINFYPFYVYRTNDQYTILYKINIKDSYYQFWNLNTNKNDYRALPHPYISSHIEQYIVEQIPAAKRYRFTRPAKLILYEKNNFNCLDVKRSGINCVIMANIPKSSFNNIFSQVNFPGSSEKESASLTSRGKAGELKYFPCHIFESKTSRVFVYQKKANSSTYFKVSEDLQTPVSYKETKPEEFTSSDLDDYIKTNFATFLHYTIYKAPEIKIDR